MINKVIEAKKLLNSQTSISKISVLVGIDRRAIKHLVDLYDEMSEKGNVPVVNNPDYVVMRKQKYILLSIRIQNKLAEMRKEFLEMQKIISSEKGKYLNAKYSYQDVRDLQEEIDNKQLYLNVTSKNLQHAEDGYEFLKREVKYNYIFWFLIGIGSTFAVLGTARNIFGLNI
jgi:hypothetical protein